MQVLNKKLQLETGFKMTLTCLNAYKNSLEMCDVKVENVKKKQITHNRESATQPIFPAGDPHDK